MNTPAPSVAPVAAQTGCEAFCAIVSEFDWDVRIMMAIMEAENRSCDPNNKNYHVGETHRDANGNVICVGSYGLFQVGCLHFSGNQNPIDPRTNITVAYQVWKKQGYGAWTMYRNTVYQQFLK